MIKPLRVVLDTNIVLSALLFAQGRLAPLRLAWQESRILPLASAATTTEIVRVLAYPKFKLSAVEQQELFADYLPHCKVVNIPANPPKIPNCRDPFDVPFLLLAAAGKASFLVSGDNDLLILNKIGSCPIVTADQFLKVIAG